MIKRHTIQCDLVLDTVNNLRNHATADEIYEEIVKTHPTISRATVYRNLHRLSEMGEIKKWEVPGSADCYDHLNYNHYHIKCKTCGKLYDVDMEYIPDLGKMIKDKHGFDFTGHMIIFEGKCPECKKKEQ